MHRVWCDKKAMHDKHKHAKRVIQSERTRCRDEKHAGLAGPPDCVQVEAEGEGEAVAAEEVQVRVEAEESVGGWDIVEGDEHLHSPRSSHPPCTSRIQALCTVS